MVVHQISDRDNAVFEAAIKLGALYHQFVGTPISCDTASTVETAIKNAVALQPYVTYVDVHLDRTLMAKNKFGYSELTGSMFHVVIETKFGSATCRAELKYDNGYPMMKVIE